MIFDKAGKKSKHIIDRTLLEMCRSHKGLSVHQIESFACLLQKMGVGFLEVDAKAAGKLEKLPANLLVYRVETAEDAALCTAHNAIYGIVNCDHSVDCKMIEFLYRAGMSITMELRVDCLKSLDRIDEIFDVLSLRFVDTVRLVGLYEYDGTWEDRLNAIRRNYRMNMDMCPTDTFHSATAIAVEALMKGADYVTASFCGFAAEDAFASLEETLVASVLLINPEEEYNLALLPQISKEFCSMTGRTIPVNKPILGRDIFKYESGIHAHGIEKNPLTYEPYDPQWVGQKREMTIGKHSGKKAVQKKLNELGISSNIDCLDGLLDAIRKESIKLKRALVDEEIRGCCKIT